jgi:hypothetical protein
MKAAVLLLSVLLIVSCESKKDQKKLAAQPIPAVKEDRQAQPTPPIESGSKFIFACYAAEACVEISGSSYQGTPDEILDLQRGCNEDGGQMVDRCPQKVIARCVIENEQNDDRLEYYFYEGSQRELKLFCDQNDGVLR